MKSLIVLAISALSTQLATANSGGITNAPVYPSINPTAVSNSYSQSSSGANSKADTQVSNNPISNSGNNSYAVIGIPSYATALPAYNCPQGDSLSWSIGWNFFSYSRSSTRTEMECLDKVLAALKSNQIPAPALPAPAQIHPVCTTEYIDSPVFLVTDSKRDIPPVRAVAKKTIKVCK
jgi:hypothetical protein